MGFYNREAINKEVTTLTTQYLQNGYWIALDKMNTLYSNAEGTVCVTNGKEIVRIQQLRTHVKEPVEGKDYSRSHQALAIEIKRYEYQKGRLREGKLLDTTTHKVFYEVKSGYMGDDKYVDDMEVLKRAKAIRSQRWDCRHIYDNKKLKNCDMDKILTMVKSRRGYKSVRKSQISGVYRVYSEYKNYYRITIMGKSDINIYLKI